MDLLRLGIVYVHLIACCVAIGLVLTNDISMVKNLFRSDARVDRQHLNDLHTTIKYSLIMLWLTGVCLVGFDMLQKGSWFDLLNPKLQAKIAIVAILTFNGFVLHRVVLPALEKAGTLLRLPFSGRLRAIFSGCVSGVSWFYAAMLGVGRPLNWNYSLAELMGTYPVLIAGGTATMLVLTTVAARLAPRASVRHERFSPWVRWHRRMFAAPTRQP